MPDLTTLLAKFLNDLYAGTLGVTLPIASVQGAAGTVGAPTYSFASAPTTGFYSFGGSNSAYAGSGSTSIAFGAVGVDSIRIGSTSSIGFASGSNPQGAASDTGVSRSGVATLAVGNGTPGDVTGTVNATIFKSGATAGVTTFGPAAVASITVKGGIITAIS